MRPRIALMKWIAACGLLLLGCVCASAQATAPCGGDFGAWLQGVKTEAAVAQITAISQSVLRQLPPGTNAPFIITYNASTVPILQLGLSGTGLSEQQLYDLGVNFLRTQLATIQGASIPLPYGGKQPQIQVDLNPTSLQAKGLFGPS